MSIPKPPRDRLDRAIVTLRGRTGLATDGGATRVQIVRGLSVRGRRRRGWRFVVAAVAAALCVPAAHAGWQGVKMLLAKREVAASDLPTKGPTARGGSATVPAVRPISLPVAVDAGQPSALPPPGVDDEKSRAGNAEWAVYERAHALHFHGGNAAAALSAWSQYLTRFPKGRLAPEARYNRAICLVKLGRIEDAQVALSELAATAPVEHLRIQALHWLERLRAKASLVRDSE